MIMRHMRDVNRIAAYLAISTLFLGVSATPGPAEQQPHRIVSLVHLLTRPSDLEGEIVLVRGYLRSGFGMRLYLTKDHASIADTASSIAIEEPEPELMKCGDAYVAVNGLFGIRDGQYGIVKTLEIVRWSDGPVRASTCWKRKIEE
jgi:hypothetical protein